MAEEPERRGSPEEPVAAQAAGPRRPPHRARDPRADRESASSPAPRSTAPSGASSAPSAPPSAFRCPGASNFRFYTVTGTYPVIPADTYELTVDGMVEPPAAAQHRRPPLDEADPARPPLPVRHGLVRARTSTGKACASPTCWSAPECSSQATALRFFSADGAYTESLTLAQAHLPDIIVADKMLERQRHRRSRRSRPALRGAHVRLQVDQVAEPDRGDQRGRPRLLGGQRLSGRRLDQRRGGDVIDAADRRRRDGRPRAGASRSSPEAICGASTSSNGSCTGARRS